MRKRFDLKRFKTAQAESYDRALAEIRNGWKESCWMWYIFPQLRFERCSQISAYYAISGIAEAKAYLADPLLRERLLTICEALLALDTNDAEEVMGFPDDKKLQSSMTLFEAAGSPKYKVFEKVLDKYFNGKRDQRTLDILKSKDSWR